MATRTAPLAQPRSYPLAPGNAWARVLWPWLPVLATAALILWLHALHGQAAQPPQPAAATLHWLRAMQPGGADPHVAGSIAVLLLIGVAATLLQGRRSITLDGQTLVVRAAFFTRRLPIAALQLDRTRVVDLAERTEFKPGLKKLGFGYPGFHAGYYRTRGGDAGFYLLTGSTRALAIALRDGGWLLLSPADPRPLLHDLQRLAAATASP